VSRFFREDHRRLEGLLAEATAAPDTTEPAPFAAFRGGLLRHIGLEERVLLPALRRARDGEPLPSARALRFDHGAIAALLVPTPTPQIVARLREILGPHNAHEEGATGLYGCADDLLRGPAEQEVLDAIAAFPTIPVNPHQDGPHIEAHVAHCIALARQAWQALEGAAR
jgi:Hemerythrin HHE cation binding domain